MVGAFIRHKLCPQSSTPAFELPVYGNLCLQVHRGYKVFNFHRKSVAKVFAPEVDAASVAREIEGARTAGLLDFAPTVHRWNTRERWYEEDYVIGRPGQPIAQSDTSDLLATYYRIIEPCIEGIVSLQAPLRLGLSEYVDQTLDVLEDDRLLRSELDERKANVVRHFVESSAEQLRLEGNRQVDLIFSHGDFCLVNIMDTTSGIMVIDWENAGRRSVLSDLYNYFLTEVFYERATTSIVPEIDKAIASLQSCLAPKVPEIASTLPSLAQMYRKLYYFERVCTLLERELSDERLDIILSSIDVFERYEQAATQRRENQ